MSPALSKTGEGGMELRGIGASGGIGIGAVVCVRTQDLDYSHVPYQGAPREKDRLRQATAEFTARIQAMVEQVTARVGEKESEILSGQITMLTDPYMIAQMEEAIDGGSCAEGAVDAVCRMFMEVFSCADDELMRQRAADVGDIRTRMLSILLRVQQADLSALPDGTVLAARDLTPSMTVGLDRSHVAAILTETGGRTSHCAILARALEVPAVLSVPGVLDTVRDGMPAIVDGDAGLVILNPAPAQLEEYRARQTAWLRERELLQRYRDRATLTADGRQVSLYANIGSVSDARAAVQAGAEGIGLFRTEFLFMDRPAPPGEEEQYETYRQVARLMAGREVIIRTLDVGGDKGIPYLDMGQEENPFLGHRAIRYCLDHPDLFKTQLRALLRAGAEDGNLKIMLPLVTGVEEVRAARALLEECRTELQAEGKACAGRIPLGVMIETPASALIADLLARESDFFSIGTNDLTQYTLAVDRGNARVAGLYTTFHPAVLRSIRQVIAAGRAAGIPVGMCGESAADPALIPLLLAFGLDEFSVSPASVLSTRKHIAGWTRQGAEQAARDAMSLPTAAQVEACLRTTTQGH